MNDRLTGLHDIIAPAVLKFDCDTIVFGEKLAKILAVIDYPSEVGPGWLARVTQLPGVVSSIHIRPADSTSLLSEINKAVKRITHKMIKSKNALIVHRCEAQLEHAQALIKKIDHEQQQIFYFSALLMVLANDEVDLRQRTLIIESQLAADGMRGRVLSLKQEEALKAVGPWLILPQGIAEFGRRYMPSESIAAAFPFTATGINDGQGVILGRDRDGGVVLLDIWKRGGDRPNSNWIILGKSGVGKSTTVKKIITNCYAQGVRVIVIDPEREYKSLCKSLNGTWIDVGSGMEGRINPLQPRITPHADETTTDASLSFVSHYQMLRTFFSLYLKGISAIEKAYLEEIIEELYSNLSTSWETCPELSRPQDWPIMSDLYNLVKHKATENKNFDNIAVLLRRASKGADSKIFNGYTNFKADADFVVLDTFALHESSIESRRTQLFNILSWTWNEVVKNKNEKIVVVIDEAYLLIDPHTPQALQFLRNASKRIRKYEGMLITISQNLSDFLDPEIKRYGQALLDNSTYKLIMAQGEKDLEALTSLMHLKEAEIELLLQGVRGEALLVAGSKRIYARIELAEHECELFGESGGR